MLHQQITSLNDPGHNVDIRMPRAQLERLQSIGSSNAARLRRHQFMSGFVVMLVFMAFFVVMWKSRMRVDAHGHMNGEPSGE